MASAQDDGYKTAKSGYKYKEMRVGEYKEMTLIGGLHQFGGEGPPAPPTPPGTVPAPAVALAALAALAALTALPCPPPTRPPQA